MALGISVNSLILIELTEIITSPFLISLIYAGELSTTLPTSLENVVIPIKYKIEKIAIHAEIKLKKLPAIKTIIFLN